MVRILLACLLASCVEQPIDQPTPTEIPGGENGFGYGCTPVYQPNELITRCYGNNHVPGMCALGICRQECINESTCPAGYDPIATEEERCWCEPKAREPWENIDISPAARGD